MNAFWNSFRRGLPILLYRQARGFGILLMHIVPVVLLVLVYLWMGIALLWALSQLSHSVPTPSFLLSWWAPTLAVSFYLLASIFLGLIFVWSVRHGVGLVSDAFIETMRRSLFRPDLDGCCGDSFWLALRRDWWKDLSRLAPWLLFMFMIFAACGLAMLTVIWMVVAVEWLFAPFQSSWVKTVLGISFFLAIFVSASLTFVYYAAATGREMEKQHVDASDSDRCGGTS